MKIRFIIIFLVTLLWSAFFKIVFDHRPVIVDEASYIFQAQTFIEGRISNPSPPNPTFFENQSLIIEPTFSSQYPPLTSLILAFGQFAFSDMLWGNIAVHALTAAIVFLMLSLYVSKKSAFTMAILFGLWPSYAFEWAGTYRSGDIIVLATTFLLISYKTLSPLTLSSGLVLLLLSRPFEGFFLSLPFVISFLIKNRTTFKKQHFLALVLITSGFAFQLIHNKSTTNHWLEHPRSLVVKQYFYNPMLNFFGTKDLSKKTTEHEQLKRYYIDYELKFYEKQESIKGYIETFKNKVLKNINFHLTYYLVPFFLLGLYLLRRSKTIIVSLLMYSIGFLAIIADLTIYTACLIPIGLLAIGKTIDLPLLQMKFTKPIVYSLFALGFYNVFIIETNYMTGRNNRSVYYKNEFSSSISSLYKDQKLVAFVKYSKDQDIHNEWIYNHPNIDSQDIIWVWDSGNDRNAEFMKNYQQRQAVCLYIDNSMPIINKKGCTSQLSKEQLGHP